MKLFNNKVKVNLNNNVINKFNNLKDENELMDFMNDNITYGWLDNKNN